jgi:tRNA(Arg) A34 adenosine deaminase TadA
MLNYLELAGEIALKRINNRNFYIGALGIRRDQATVTAYNQCALEPTPSVHAEARLSRKLDHGSTVYVARIKFAKTDHAEYALAKPCYDCMRALKHKRVKKVYYTISNFEWGVIDLCYTGK